MKSIAVFSGKGGVGKSTLCLLLAVAAEDATIIDCDPQSSLGWWADERGRPPEVESAQPGRLSRVLKKVKSAYAFVDTPGALIPGSIDALRAVDLVLIVSPVEAFELAALNDTLNAAALSGTPTVIVVNRLAPQAKGEGAIELLEEAEVEVCPQILRERAAHRHALFNGETCLDKPKESAAATEVRAIWAWLKERLDGIA